MLEGCRDLAECEDHLRSYIDSNHIRLIGSIPLSSEDVRLLDTKVLNYLQLDPVNGTRFLVKNAPLCFALFLVWQGIRSYRNGDYWSAVHETTNIANIRYQALWGRGFIQALKKHGLPTIEDEQGRPYVAPILFHGGIPDCCLREYFTAVAWKYFVGSGVTSQPDIRSLLNHWRREAERLGAIRQDVEELKREIRAERDFIATFEKYLKLGTEIQRVHAYQKALQQALALEESVLQLQNDRDLLFEKLRDAQRKKSGFRDRERNLLSTAEQAAAYRSTVSNLETEFHELKDRMVRRQQVLDQLSRNLLGSPWIEHLRLCVSAFDGDVWRDLWARLNETTKPACWIGRLALTGGILATGSLAAAFGAGMSWPVGILGLTGLALAAFAIHRLRALTKTRTDLQRRLEEMVEGFASKEELLAQREEAARGLERLQELLREEERDWLRVGQLDQQIRGLVEGPDSLNFIKPSVEAVDGILAEDRTWNHCLHLDQVLSALVGRLEGLQNMTEQWMDAIREAERKRLEADEADSEIGPLESRLADIESELREKQAKQDEILKQILVPEGLSFEKGSNRVDWLRQKIASLREWEAGVLRQIAELEGQLSPSLTTRLSTESAEAERNARYSRLQEKERQLASLAESKGIPPLYEVDRPIQRFLLEGEAWADQFVFNTVSLLAESCKVGRPMLPELWPTTYRYERIKKVFDDWWGEEGYHFSLDYTRDYTRRSWMPRLVCWKKGGEWVVGVRILESLVDTPDLQVLQNDRPLSEAAQPDRWYLETLDGTVSVRWAEDREATLDVEAWRYKGKPIFLFQGWDGYTKTLPAIRKPGKISRLVAIVPESWRSGDCNIPSEIVVKPAGYQLYYLDADENKSITLIDSEGESIKINLHADRPRFELRGTTISVDRGGEHGPLFIVEPPRLYCMDEDTLEDIGWGEVLPSGEPIPPVSDSNWLSEGVSVPLGKPSGSFEVVLYDKHRVEMERLPFRFVSCLNRICLFPDPVPVFPDPGRGRHDTITVEFTATGICQVKLVTPHFDGAGLSIDNREQFTLPPIPSFDTTSWEVQARGGEPVPVEIAIGRVWWTVGCCGEVPGDEEWGDRVVDFDVSWFKATSDRALWIKTPGSAFQSEVEAGFDGSPERLYRMDDKGLTEIPLREFSDVVAASTEQDLTFKVHLVERDGREAIGQIGVCRLHVAGQECHFCLYDKEGLGLEERSRSCYTCSLCHRGPDYIYCEAGTWRERLQTPDFDRLKAGNVCPKWEGEYPGEAFADWESLIYKGKRVYANPNAEEFGIPGHTFGVTTKLVEGRLCIRWDENLSQIHSEIWVCKFHFGWYFTCLDESLGQREVS